MRRGQDERKPTHAFLERRNVFKTFGLLAGLGGAMSAAKLHAAIGLQLGQSYELDAIAAVILGGTSFVGGIGSIWGTLIGAVALDRLRSSGSART